MFEEDYFTKLFLNQLGKGLTIEEFRKDLTNLTNICCNWEEQEKYREAFSVGREQDINILKEVDSFFIDEDKGIASIPEKYHSEIYGFVKYNHFTMQGRYVLPVKDVLGRVAGFVGYDKFERPKYLDSVNYGYKAKSSNIFYGMENLRKYYEDGYVLVVEGSMCALYLRSVGLNALAFLGSTITPYQVDILTRFKDKAYIIPDTDKAGINFKSKINKVLPKARTLQVQKGGKDIDEVRKVYPQVVEEIRILLKNPFSKTEYIR